MTAAIVLGVALLACLACLSLWRAGYRAGLARAAAIAASDPELPGDEPPDFAAAFDAARSRRGLAEACRALVRATKESIERRIREAE